MAIMTAQLPLMLVPAGAVEIGEVAALVEDEAGGNTFNLRLHGCSLGAWAVRDRRY